jgi:hypothetical protein
VDKTVVVVAPFSYGWQLWMLLFYCSVVVAAVVVVCELQLM